MRGFGNCVPGILFLFFSLRFAPPVFGGGQRALKRNRRSVCFIALHSCSRVKPLRSSTGTRPPLDFVEWNYEVLAIMFSFVRPVERTVGIGELCFFTRAGTLRFRRMWLAPRWDSWLIVDGETLELFTIEKLKGLEMLGSPSDTLRTALEISRLSRAICYGP